MIFESLLINYVFICFYGFLLEGLEKSANDLEDWLENMVRYYNLYNITYV